ncbi:MAG: S-adenosylmethionine decarboxylase [Candidatus Pacearchaeota archaeon]
MHLILDCKVDPAFVNLLVNTRHIDNVMRTITSELGMTLMQNPIVYGFPSVGDQQSGVTGTAIWAESHMAIHTWPELCYFSCDLYSCKEFDSQKALSRLTDLFHIEEISVVTVTRSEDLVQTIQSKEHYGV